MDIRMISQGQDAQQYQKLCKYCFPNPGNWTDRIFPLPENDRAFGGFYGDTLQAATISKRFSASLFGQSIIMNGIGAVASAPQGRNSGTVREVLTYTLQHELKRGMVVSALYPFLFQFYEKLGYGYVGGLTAYTCKPEDIRPFTTSGACIPVTLQEHAKALRQVHNQFVRQYDLGIDFSDDTAKYPEHLSTFGSYAYIYQRDGDTRGYLEYRLIEDGPYTKIMRVERFGYMDVETFQALLALIRSHRNQCHELIILVPGNVPLRPVFQEPRVKVETSADWMARPLDVETVLRMRLAVDPCDRNIAFSLKDPILPQNTGTYTLQGTTVTKSAHNGQQLLSFPIFSSLLFNTITFEQACYAGKIDWHDETVAEYFSKKGDIYVSAGF